ncbi:hemolysin type calcium-binding protein [Palleronia aestuarii]|uniref:Hemolysin type calcium-binding protein n=1 Tax=Palleronia aestuarii TaxID=568105 RepID=A0A2W7Q5E0_9RHOB|nr:calcium-binding protein [Palleronia aestuarii]PZX16929.1 hemolysin type calcium-binding protein [Palleronia aestuarii]
MKVGIGKGRGKAEKAHDDDDHDLTDGHGSGHDRDGKSGLGLGHDREDKNGRALGHRDHDDEADHSDDIDIQEDVTSNIDAGAMLEELCNADSILFVGDSSDETIAGKCNNDELYGGRGSDTISGGKGNDYLSGNWGDDILIGGEGADTFSFDGDFDRDTVTDFSLSDGDRLDFIFYEQHQSDWTAQMLVDLFVQSGDDAILELPSSDDVVVLANTDVSSLSVDIVSVTHLYVQDEFLT